MDEGLKDWLGKGSKDSFGEGLKDWLSERGRLQGLVQRGMLVRRPLVGPQL